MAVGSGGRVAVGGAVAVSVLWMAVAAAVGEGGGGVSVSLGVLEGADAEGVDVASGDGAEGAQLATARTTRKAIRKERAMLRAGGSYRRVREKKSAMSWLE